MIPQKPKTEPQFLPLYISIGATIKLPASLPKFLKKRLKDELESLSFSKHFMKVMNQHIEAYPRHTKALQRGEYVAYNFSNWGDQS